MNFALRVDALKGWIYRSPFCREVERRLYQSSLYRWTRSWWNQQLRMKEDRQHLYEFVIGNGHVWIKLQITGTSARFAAGLIERRFNGLYFVSDDGRQSVTPFKLSQCADHIANWTDEVSELPDGWDKGEFSIEQYPYAWCSRLADDCCCNVRSPANAAVVASYGLRHEVAKRNERTENAWYEHRIAELETRVAKNDEAQRVERTRQAAEKNGEIRSKATFVYPRVPIDQGSVSYSSSIPSEVVTTLNQSLHAGFYCSIEKRHHSFSDQTIRRTVASLNLACDQMMGLGVEVRKSSMSHLPLVAKHYLDSFQSEECARKAAWGDKELPRVLYKYIPRERLYQGAPNSLRATPLLALNDPMECNVITMKDINQSKIAMLRSIQKTFKDYLNIDVTWEDLLKNSIQNSNPRLSSYIQTYLNPLVGVVSLSTDCCDPTMWAHYADNTGVVVGYKTEDMQKLGFELQPVVYSEIAPIYRPLSSDRIYLDFVNRERVADHERTGESVDGQPVLTSTELATIDSNWQSIARLLFVKGMSWEYEKEVRLLVDLNQARVAKTPKDGVPVKVIDIPVNAIVEIFSGERTSESDVNQAIKLARPNDDKEGLAVGRLSSHAYRIQKSYVMKY